MDLPGIFDAIPGFLNFYESAEKRNQALLANTIKRMRERGEHVACLVTGGFHSRGITELLKNQDMSYLVILPRFNKKSTRPYLTIVTNQSASYREWVNSAQVLETKRRMIAHYFAQVAFSALKDKENVSVARKNELIRKAVDAAKEEYLRVIARSPQAPSVISSPQGEKSRPLTSVSADTLATMSQIQTAQIDTVLAASVSAEYLGNSQIGVYIGATSTSTEGQTFLYTATTDLALSEGTLVQTSTDLGATTTLATTDRSTLESGAEATRVDETLQKLDTLMATGSVDEVVTYLGVVIEAQEAEQARSGETREAVQNRAELFRRVVYFVASHGVLMASSDVAQKILELNTTCSICSEVVTVDMGQEKATAETALDLSVFMATMQSLAQGQVVQTNISSPISTQTQTATLNTAELNAPILATPGVNINETTNEVTPVDFLEQELQTEFIKSLSVDGNSIASLQSLQGKEIVDRIRKAHQEKNPKAYYDALMELKGLLVSGTISTGDKRLDADLRAEYARLLDWAEQYEALEKIQTELKSAFEADGINTDLLNSPDKLTRFLNRFVLLSKENLSSNRYYKAQQLFFEGVIELIDANGEIEEKSLKDSLATPLGIPLASQERIYKELSEAVQKFRSSLAKFGEDHIDTIASASQNASRKLEIEKYFEKVQALKNAEERQGAKEEHLTFVTQMESDARILALPGAREALIKMREAIENKEKKRQIDSQWAYGEQYLIFWGIYQKSGLQFADTGLKEKIEDEGRRLVRDIFKTRDRPTVKAIAERESGVELLKDQLQIARTKEDNKEGIQFWVEISADQVPWVFEKADAKQKDALEGQRQGKNLKLSIKAVEELIDEIDKKKMESLFSPASDKDKADKKAKATEFATAFNENSKEIKRLREELQSKTIESERAAIKEKIENREDQEKSLFFEYVDKVENKKYRFLRETAKEVLQSLFAAEKKVKTLEERIDNTRKLKGKSGYEDKEDEIDAEIKRLQLEIATTQEGAGMTVDIKDVEGKSVDVTKLRSEVEKRLGNNSLVEKDVAFSAQVNGFTEAQVKEFRDGVEAGRLVTGDGTVKNKDDDLGVLEKIQRGFVDMEKTELLKKAEDASLDSETRERLIAQANRFDFKDKFRQGRLRFEETNLINEKSYFFMQRLIQFSPNHKALAKALMNSSIEKIPMLFAELDKNSSDPRSREEENLYTAFLFNQATGLYFMNKQLVGLSKIRSYNLAAGTGTGKTFIEFAAAAQEIVRMINHRRSETGAVFINVPNRALVEQFFSNPKHRNFVRLMTGGNEEVKFVKGKEDLLDKLQSEHDEEAVLKILEKPVVVIIDMESAGFLRQSSRTLQNKVSRHLEHTVEFIDEGDALYTNLSDYVGSTGEKKEEEMTLEELARKRTLERRRSEATKLGEERIKMAEKLVRGENLKDSELDLELHEKPTVLTTFETKNKKGEKVSVNVEGWKGQNLTVVTSLEYFSQSYIKDDSNNRYAYLNQTNGEVLLNAAAVKYFEDNSQILREGKTQNNDTGFRLDGLDKGHLQTVVAVALRAASKLNGFRDITFIKEKNQYVYTGSGQLRSNQVPGDLQLLQALNARRQAVTEKYSNNKVPGKNISYEFAETFDKVVVLDTSGGVSGFELFRKESIYETWKRSNDIGQSAGESSEYTRLRSEAEREAYLKKEFDDWQEKSGKEASKWIADNEAFLRMGSATQGEVVEFGVLMQGVGVYDVDTFEEKTQGVSFDLWNAFKTKMMDQKGGGKVSLRVGDKEIQNFDWNERFERRNLDSFEKQYQFAIRLLENFVANKEKVGEGEIGNLVYSENVKNRFGNIEHEKGKIIENSSLLLSFGRNDVRLKEAIKAYAVSRGWSDMLGEIDGLKTEGAHHVENEVQKTKNNRRIIFTDLVGTRGNDFQANLMIVNFNQEMTGGELMQLFGRGGRSDEKRGGNFDVKWVQVMNKESMRAIVEEFFHVKEAVLGFMGSPFFNPQTRDLFEKIAGMSREEALDYLSNDKADQNVLHAIIFQSEWNLIQKKSQAMMRLWTAGLMYMAVTRHVNQALEILRAKGDEYKNTIQRLEGVNNKIFAKEGDSSSTQHIHLSNHAQNSGSIAQTAFRGVIEQAQKMFEDFVGSDSEIEKNVPQEVKDILRNAKNDIEEMSKVELSTLESLTEDKHAGNVTTLKEMASLHTRFERAFAPSHTTNQKPVKELTQLAKVQEKTYRSFLDNEKSAQNQARFAENKTNTKKFESEFKEIVENVLSYALTRYHSGASYQEEMGEAKRLIRGLAIYDREAAELMEEILSLMERNDAGAGERMDFVRNELNKHFERRGINFYIYTRMSGENANLLSVYNRLENEVVDQETIKRLIDSREFPFKVKGKEMGAIKALVLTRIDGLPDDLEASINVAESLANGRFVPIYYDKIRDNVLYQMMDKATGVTRTFLKNIRIDFDQIRGDQAAIRARFKKEGITDSAALADELFLVKGKWTGIQVTMDGAISFNRTDPENEKRLKDEIEKAYEAELNKKPDLRQYRLDLLLRKRGEAIEGMVNQITMAAIAARDKKTKADPEDKTLEWDAINEKIESLILDAQFREEQFSKIIDGFDTLKNNKDQTLLLDAITKAEVNMLTTHEFAHELDRLLSGERAYKAKTGGQREYIAHLASTLGPFGMMALEQIFGYHSLAGNTDGWLENYKIPTLQLITDLAEVLKIKLPKNFPKDVKELSQSPDAKMKALRALAQVENEILKKYKDDTEKYKEKVLELLEEKSAEQLRDLGITREGLDFSPLLEVGDKEAKSGDKTSQTAISAEFLPSLAETKEREELAESLLPSIDRTYQDKFSSAPSPSPQAPVLSSRLLGLIGAPPPDDEDEEEKARRLSIRSALAQSMAEKIQSGVLKDIDYRYQLDQAVEALLDVSGISVEADFSNEETRVVIESAESKINDFSSKAQSAASRVVGARLGAPGREGKLLSLLEPGRVRVLKPGVDIEEYRTKINLIRDILGIVVIGQDTPELMQVDLIREGLAINSPSSSKDLHAWAFREAAGEEFFGEDFARHFSRSKGISPLSREIEKVEQRALDKGVTREELILAFFSGADVMQDRVRGTAIYDELANKAIESAIHPALKKSLKDLRTKYNREDLLSHVERMIVANKDNPIQALIAAADFLDNLKKKDPNIGLPDSNTVPLEIGSQDDKEHQSLPKTLRGWADYLKNEKEVLEEKRKTDPGISKSFLNSVVSTLALTKQSIKLNEKDLEWGKVVEIFYSLTPEDIDKLSFAIERDEKVVMLNVVSGHQVFSQNEVLKKFASIDSRLFSKDAKEVEQVFAPAKADVDWVSKRVDEIVTSEVEEKAEIARIHNGMIKNQIMRGNPNLTAKEADDYLNSRRDYRENLQLIEAYEKYFTAEKVTYAKEKILRNITYQGVPPSRALLEFQADIMTYLKALPYIDLDYAKTATYQNAVKTAQSEYEKILEGARGKAAELGNEADSEFLREDLVPSLKEDVLPIHKDAWTRLQVAVPDEKGRIRFQSVSEGTKEITVWGAGKVLLPADQEITENQLTGLLLHEAGHLLADFSNKTLREGLTEGRARQLLEKVRGVSAVREYKAIVGVGSSEGLYPEEVEEISQRYKGVDDTVFLDLARFTGNPIYLTGDEVQIKEFFQKNTAPSALASKAQDLKNEEALLRATTVSELATFGGSRAGRISVYFQEKGFDEALSGHLAQVVLENRDSTFSIATLISAVGKMAQNGIPIAALPPNLFITGYVIPFVESGGLTQAEEVPVQLETVTDDRAYDADKIISDLYNDYVPLAAPDASIGRDILKKFLENTVLVLRSDLYKKGRIGGSLGIIFDGFLVKYNKNRQAGSLAGDREIGSLLSQILDLSSPERGISNPEQVAFINSLIAESAVVSQSKPFLPIIPQPGVRKLPEVIANARSLKAEIESGSADISPDKIGRLLVDAINELQAAGQEGLLSVGGSPITTVLFRALSKYEESGPIANNPQLAGALSQFLKLYEKYKGPSGRNEQQLSKFRQWVVQAASAPALPAVSVPEPTTAPKVEAPIQPVPEAAKPVAEQPSVANVEQAQPAPQPSAEFVRIKTVIDELGFNLAQSQIINSGKVGSLTVDEVAELKAYLQNARDKDREEDKQREVLRSQYDAIAEKNWQLIRSNIKGEGFVGEADVDQEGNIIRMGASLPYDSTSLELLRIPININIRTKQVDIRFDFARDNIIAVMSRVEALAEEGVQMMTFVGSASAKPRVRTSAEAGEEIATVYEQYGMFGFNKTNQLNISQETFLRYLDSITILLDTPTSVPIPTIIEIGYAISHGLFRFNRAGLIKPNQEIFRRLETIKAKVESVLPVRKLDPRLPSTIQEYIDIAKPISAGARLAQTQNILAGIVLLKGQGDDVLTDLAQRFPDVQFVALTQRDGAEEVLAGVDPQGARFAHVVVDIFNGTQLVNESPEDLIRRISEALASPLENIRKAAAQLPEKFRRFEGLDQNQIEDALRQMSDRELDTLFKELGDAISQEAFSPVNWDELLAGQKEVTGVQMNRAARYQPIQEALGLKLEGVMASLIQDPAYAPHINLLPVSGAFLPKTTQLDPLLAKTLSRLPLGGKVYFYSGDKEQVKALRGQLAGVGLGSFEVLDASGIREQDYANALKEKIKNPDNLPLTLIVNREELKFESVVSPKMAQNTQNRFIPIPKGVPSSQLLALALVAPTKTASVLYVTASDKEKVPTSILEQYGPWLLPIALPIRIFEELRQAIRNLRQTAAAA